MVVRVAAERRVRPDEAGLLQQVIPGIFPVIPRDRSFEEVENDAFQWSAPSRARPALAGDAARN